MESMFTWLSFAFICSIPFILLIGGIYGDYRATGKFPWQEGYDVKCFHVKKPRGNM